MPDEVGAFDAIPAKVEETFGAKGKSEAELEQNLHDNQRSTHALTGGAAAEEGKKSIDMILDTSNSNAVAGIAIHRLGDTYSHRVMGKKDRIDNAELYREGLGHFWHGTAPDEIHRRPDLYQDYITDLARTLATRLHGDNQEAIDAAVTRAQSRAKEFAELTVELKQKNTYKLHREKSPPMTRTNDSKTREYTVKGFRAKILSNTPKLMRAAQ